MEEFHALSKRFKDKIKFKNLIDFYLSSSNDFAKSLRQIDADTILAGITSIPSVPVQQNNNQDDELDRELLGQQTNGTQDQGHGDNPERFNENVLKVLCIKQAIEKMTREMNVLKDLKENLLIELENSAVVNRGADIDMP